MMFDYLQRHVLPAAYSVLPIKMQSPPADAMLLAIALQESEMLFRRQGGRGPARGFWQFEEAGTSGVLRHPSSRAHARFALTTLCYSPDLPAKTIHQILEHNDALACVFARLLLYTLPQTLPLSGDVADAWHQYLAGWRPGKPRAKDWPLNYADAWAAVTLPRTGELI